MSVSALILVGLIVAVAAAAQTIAGFGFSLLSVPPLGMVIDPKEAVAVAMVLLAVNSAQLSWGEREHIAWPATTTLLLGAAAGLPVGLLILNIASVDALRIGLAVAIFVSIALLVRDLTPPDVGGTFTVMAGFLTGALTTSLNTNGPPTVVALQAAKLRPEQFRPTAGAVLGVTATAGTILFAIAGKLDGDVPAALAVGLPCVAVGWWFGARAQPHIADELFGRVVLVLLGAAGVATLVAVLV